MLSYSRVMAVLSLAAGANAGVCGNMWSSRNSLCAGLTNTEQRECYRNECASLGCKVIGNVSNCHEPTACSASGDIVYAGLSTSDKRTGVRANRKPLSPEVARLCDADADCSAIYTVTLSRRWATGPPNCNDMGMLPPHGVNQSACKDIAPNLYKNTGGMMNYIGHPYKNDGVKQSVAAAQNAVTALTEETQSCFNTGETNGNCAFPLGYASDTIQKGKKVCVNVMNAKDRWIEIMASSKSGSDASFCVKDRNKDELTDGDKGCAKAGALVDIRESGQSIGTDEMQIEFFTEDNFDDANIDFHWRIAASEVVPPSAVGTDEVVGTDDTKDGEDWAQHRDGADYPMSLMKPYPEGYEGDAVFESEGDSSASAASPFLFLVLVASFIASLF